MHDGEASLVIYATAAIAKDCVAISSKIFIFTLLWLFDVMIAHGGLSLPAPSMPHDRHWATFHSVMATPLQSSFLESHKF
ncbi:unnamed protein product [Thlaspi arvense]|uniref:Uncharacterized protein n=1 Tax=Thlaspi arvense TaxID=13288 RepID=A0AAU9RWG7_THLAR|nr:unnamed protein product [Thlaspi arvense]